MTQEELLGTGLVLRRPSRVTSHTVVAAIVAGGSWFLTIVLTWFGLSAPSRRWWLLLAFAGGLSALGVTVLAVRAATSRVVLTRSRVSVVSLTGRRSVPWADVVAVQTGRPYLGVLGAMPVLKLSDSRAIAVDAVACRLMPNVAHPDRDRIAEYLEQPGLPSTPPPNFVTQPAGPATGGSLVIRRGAVGTAPNAFRPAARLLVGRLVVPVLLGFFVVAVAVMLLRLLLSHWMGATVAAAAALAFGLASACLTWAFARRSVLSAGYYRNPCLVGGVEFAWPPDSLWIEEGVNLWGTRFVGHLVVKTGRNAAPVHLWETSRVSPEAFALARVAVTY